MSIIEQIKNSTSEAEIAQLIEEHVLEIVITTLSNK